MTDDEAITYLKLRGFRLTTRWTWVAPDDRDATPDEWERINYLVWEWDFGGLDKLDWPTHKQTRQLQK